MGSKAVRNNHHGDFSDHCSPTHEQIELSLSSLPLECLWMRSTRAIRCRIIVLLFLKTRHSQKNNNTEDCWPKQMNRTPQHRPKRWRKFYESNNIFHGFSPCLTFSHFQVNCMSAWVGVVTSTYSGYPLEGFQCSWKRRWKKSPEIGHVVRPPHQGVMWASPLIFRSRDLDSA